MEAQSTIPLDISSCNSQSPLSAQHAAECVISSRKAWKTIKSQNEAVWPPAVEAALIAGLEKYRPKSVKDVSLLKRFPKRNSWISDYIKRTTGRDRSPKQVGSRLQQLRDTCTDERVHKLLFRREYSPDSMESSGSDRGSRLDLASTSCSPVCSPSDPTMSERSTVSDTVHVSFVAPVTKPCKSSPADALSHTSVCIELTSPSSRGLPSHEAALGKEDFHCFPVIRTQQRQMLLLAPHPSACIHEPTISFSSPTLLSPFLYSSLFRVFVSGTLVHSDWTSLAYLSMEKLASDGYGSATVYNYGTRFIPCFWNRIGRDFDPSQCTVSQYICERDAVESSSSQAPSPGGIQVRVAHIITYEFSVRQLAVSGGAVPASSPGDYDSSLRIDTSLGSTRRSFELTSAPGVPSPLQASPLQVLPGAFDALGLNSPSYSPGPDGRAHYPSANLSNEQGYTPSPSFIPSESENNTPRKSLDSQQPLEVSLNDHLFLNDHSLHQGTASEVPRDATYERHDVSEDDHPIPPNVAVSSEKANSETLGAMQSSLSQSLSLEASDHYPSQPSSNEWDGQAWWSLPMSSNHTQSQLSGVAREQHPTQQVYDSASWNTQDCFDQDAFSCNITASGGDVGLPVGYMPLQSAVGQMAGAFQCGYVSPCDSHGYVHNQHLQPIMSESYRGQSQILGMSTGLNVNVPKGFNFLPEVFASHFDYDGIGLPSSSQTYSRMQ